MDIITGDQVLEVYMAITLKDLDLVGCMDTIPFLRGLIDLILAVLNLVVCMDTIPIIAVLDLVVCMDTIPFLKGQDLVVCMTLCGIF